MNNAAKNHVEKFSEEGLPTGKVAAMFNGSYLAFSNRDCWNHMRKLRMKNLDIGDAQAIYNYCRQKHAQDSNFFYQIQFDDDAKMVNFLWVDARSRLAYQQFGDVITFDTTYNTNKYSMPFASFTGLNHHLQSILFGSALLQDESETSFIWLFETWLKAMHGKKPMSIITDQDVAIGGAVAKVFPEARHRLCFNIYSITVAMEKEAHNVNETYPEFNQHNLMCETLHEVSSFNINDPHISQTKGRRKDSDKVAQGGRFKSGLELSINKSIVKKRRCQFCGEHGHYQSTCKQKKT